jgi:hypothetical protein
METEKIETACSTNRSDLHAEYKMSIGNMTVAIELPKTISEGAEGKRGDLSENAFELLALECYRSGLVAPEQLHRLLSLRRGPA